MNIRIGYIFLFFSLIYFSVIVYFGVFGSYRTPDEIYYLTASYDFVHISYLFWVIVVTTLSGIDENIVFIVNYFLLAIPLLILYRRGVISSSFIILIFMSPMTLYFVSSYLRDIVFYSLSLFTILHLSSGSKTKIGLLVIIAVAFALRVEFGLILVTAYCLSADYFRKYVNIYLGFLLPFSAGFLFLITQTEVYDLYYDFFYYGHADNPLKNNVGLLAVPWENFSQYQASINYLLSPLYLWFVPAVKDYGLFALLVLFDSVLYSAAFAFLCYRFLFQGYAKTVNQDRALRFCFVMLIGSLFFSASVTYPTDVFRMRLFFVPCLLFLAFSSLRSSAAT